MTSGYGIGRLTRTKCCTATIVVGLPPRGMPRCTGCGHRVPLGSYVPEQSRALPLWTWPGELLGRRRARRRQR